nr:hypothetical protein Iba_chr01fCG7840 [Ipomoea batatas]
MFLTTTRQKKLRRRHRMRAVNKEKRPNMGTFMLLKSSVMATTESG